MKTGTDDRSVFDQSRPVTPCPIVEVSGDARERGRSHGEQAAERIKGGFGHYAAQLDRLEIDGKRLDALARRFEPKIAAFDANYIDEMHGIAEGAGVEYGAILLLNARTEILKLARHPDKVEEFPEDPDGCTGVVVLPERATNGKLIHGLNWDWKAECAETSIVLKIAREDGPDILAFTEAGQLARAGFNSAGISVTGNYLECERDYRTLGVPMPFIRRKILEQDRLAMAMHTAYTTPKSASINLIVTHPQGIALDFECAPNETFPVSPSGGMIVHANHFQSAVALTKLIERGVANMPDSLYRDARVRSLLAARDRITIDDVKAALFDDFETPWAVCRPPRQSFANNLSATVAMLVMEPASGTMEVAMLPALDRSFQTFKLDMEVQYASAT